MNSRPRVEKLVREVLPKGRPAKIYWVATGLGGSHILRVLTPAWKSLPRSERIFRLHEGLEPQLTSAERKKIFRISVLTSEELKRLRLQLAA
jgi:hypothetical protein